MSFIELTLKYSKTPIGVNMALIASIDDGPSSTRVITVGDDKHYEVSESYSNVMAKIHKAKRLKIASRLAGMIYECGLQKVTCEAVSKVALKLAEELIKQNEVME